mgnify:FL=1
MLYVEDRAKSGYQANLTHCPHSESSRKICFHDERIVFWRVSPRCNDVFPVSVPKFVHIESTSQIDRLSDIDDIAVPIDRVTRWQRWHVRRSHHVELVPSARVIPKAPLVVVHSGTTRPD